MAIELHVAAAVLSFCLEGYHVKIVGMVLLVTGLSGAVMGAVPEIDASSGMSALAFLSGTLLVIKSRRKNQK